MSLEEIKNETSVTLKSAKADRLLSLGLVSASNKVKQALDLQRKLAIAYEHYKFVRAEKIVAFQQKLYANTVTTDKYGASYKELRFDLIENYADVPPDSVLDSLVTAKERSCFDYFEVAHIVAAKKVPDPILFGCIRCCSDRFFVDQWDEDVKIQDILKENEG